MNSVLHEEATVQGSEFGENMRKTPEGFDLLRVPGVRALILWRGFPYVFQGVTLAAFLALLITGWQRYTPPGVSQKLYAQTNLATLMVWGLWWPAMVWIAVLFGRAWCMVCPLELVSNVSERLGRRLGLRQRPLRPWIASGAIIVFLYALIQFFVAGAEIRRVPAYTSFFLIGLLLLALLAGLFLKDRAFCRGFCPVALLLSAYGRGGMLALRAGSGETCRVCTGKECIRACNRNKADGRSCPSLLNPPKLDSNKDCLVCGQCIKVCEPDNMRLLLRRPFSGDDTREPSASWPMTLFIMIVSGFVLWELTTEWPAAERVFTAPSEWASHRIPVPWISGYIAGLWAMIVVPLVVWLVFGLTARLSGARGSIATIWRRLALPMTVVIAAGHMAKGMAKFVSWAGFLPMALDDPSGLQAAAAITAGTLHAPGALLGKSAVSVAAAILIAISMFLAVREARIADCGRAGLAAIAPLMIMSIVSAFLVLGWGFPIQ